jgi:hypothetical protein
MKPIALLPFALAALVVAGCGSTQTSNGGGGATQTNADTLLATTHQAGECTAAPDAVVTAINGNLNGVELTHVFSGQSGDWTLVAGRIEGPGRLGNDIAVFALSDPTAAGTIYAIGPNAASNSSLEKGEEATGLDLNTAEVRDIAACARQG